MNSSIDLWFVLSFLLAVLSMTITYMMHVKRLEVHVLDNEQIKQLLNGPLIVEEYQPKIGDEEYVYVPGSYIEKENKGENYVE